MPTRVVHIPRFKTKKARERAHAKRRAKERYGWRLNRADLRALVDQIKTRQATLLKIYSLTRSKWEVSYQGQTAIVVYDKKRQEIKTFLPPQKQ